MLDAPANNLQKPYPLTIFAGLISKSYSCNVVTQFTLFSPNSLSTINCLTVEKKTTTFV